MQQVAQIERERDDYKTQVTTIRKQLQEAHESQSKGDSKLNKVLQSLRSLQDEKGSLEARLGQKEIALHAQVTLLSFFLVKTNMSLFQTEALNKKTQEVQEIRDKLVSLELTVNNSNEEKSHYQVKCPYYNNYGVSSMV